LLALFCGIHFLFRFLFTLATRRFVFTLLVSRARAGFGVAGGAREAAPGVAENALGVTSMA
jgi:hypothetical protein